MTTSASRSALVVCVGNSLVADDAAGWRVGEHLGAAGLPDGVRLGMLGVGGLDLLDQLAGDDTLVVVDAVHFGAAPGTVHRLDWDDLPEAGRSAVSVHGIGVREAIDVGRALGMSGLPRRIVLVGIEGRCFDRVGEPCSPEVEAAIPIAAGMVLDLLMARTQ